MTDLPPESRRKSKDSAPLRSAPSAGPTPERIGDLVRAAADFVRRAVGVEIDLSEESLAFVDHYLDTVRGDAQRRGEFVGLVAAALGAHFGEVAIAKFGGHWGVAPGAADRDEPAAWVVELERAPLRFMPAGIAAEALAVGEAPGYDSTLATSLELTQRLQTALDRVPPVSAEYFYSLTGRLETITYAVDLLMELARQGQESAASSSLEDEDELGEGS